jgi:hypothetical protein
MDGWMGCLGVDQWGCVGVWCVVCGVTLHCRSTVERMDSLSRVLTCSSPMVTQCQAYRGASISHKRCR